MSMTIILSKTGEFLWDNQIPSLVFDYIEQKTGLTKNDTMKLKRHDSLLIESFRHTYGQYLESSQYAHLIEIPYYCHDMYEIVRVPCYLSKFYPESISIDIERCLEFHQGQPDYHGIKDELRRITTYQFGVKANDSLKHNFIHQRFNIIKNTY